jgi:hypothetical protein
MQGVELRRQWAEGQLARELGRTVEAESLLARVRDGFIEQGISFDAANVTLDLSVLFLRTGRAAEAEDLAHEARAVFVALGVEREALAAFLLASWAGATPRA